MWTGKGDDGTSGLLYGGREPKTSPRFDAVGTVDEAQAAIGVARAEVPHGSELDVILIALERDLWVLMAELATDAANREKLIPRSEEHTSALQSLLRISYAVFS